jgi:DNA-directed RNA polymerase subunit H
MKKEIIVEHILVPKHEILPKEEATAVLKKLGVGTDVLPKIKQDDSVVKAIEAKRGDLLKITRRSPTAGESVYYRIVV